MFNPFQPHLLYASFRRGDAVWCWDVRGNGARPVQILDPSLPTPGDVTATGGTEEQPARPSIPKTNQRLKFDVDICGSRLGVGDQVNQSPHLPPLIMSTEYVIVLAGRQYLDF